MPPVTHVPGGSITWAPGRRPRWTSEPTRQRFQVRRIDLERRVYVFVADFARYYDACLAADHAVASDGGPHIVWDATEKRPLYDSRQIARGHEPMQRALFDDTVRLFARTGAK